VISIDRSVRAEVEATADRCLDLLERADRYPQWASLITNAEPAGDGRVRLRASVLGFSVEMLCELSVDRSAGRALLRRLPEDAEDAEAYESAWTVRHSGSGTTVELEVRAALEAPGPARLVRGRIERALADDLLADFVRALGAG
jgi:hypothetical protein